MRPKKLDDAIAHHGVEDSIINTIVVDIDGVLADFYQCGWDCRYDGYPDGIELLKRSRCPVVPQSQRALRNMSEAGLKISLVTGRVESERRVTLDWLRDNHFVFDELIMDKPRAIMYIDDMGYHFNNWDSTILEVCKRYAHLAPGLRKLHFDENMRFLMNEE